MSSIRFAIIGCGRVTKNHVGPLRETPGAELASVCDINMERAKALGTQCGVPFYTNYHTMLQREKIDVVNIVTPSGMHPEHVTDIIERYQKHIVVEKPMVLNWNDVAKMRDAARRHHVKIFPVYQNRYNKAVVKVRQDIETGAFGKLSLGTVRLRWCRPQRYYDQSPWRGTWAMDGGAMTNQGIHYIDLLQYLLGDVDTVYTRTATQLVNVEVEDTAAAVVSFKNGALGLIEITTAARPDDIEASISILGEKGTAVIGGIASNHLDVYTLNPAAREENSENFVDAYGYGHWPFFRDVVSDLSGKHPHPISFEEGTRAIGLLNSLYRSAEDKKAVSVGDHLASRQMGRSDPKLHKLYHTDPERTA